VKENSRFLLKGILWIVYIKKRTLRLVLPADEKVGLRGKVSTYYTVRRP